MRAGDKILRLDEESVPAWSTFCERLLAEPDRPHRVDFLSARDGRARSGTIQLRREEFTDEHGQSFERYVLPLQHWAPVAPEEWALTPPGAKTPIYQPKWDGYRALYSAGRLHSRKGTNLTPLFPDLIPILTARLPPGHQPPPPTPRP